MKYALDTEFFERGPSRPVELISLGIVAEDGRTYYAVNQEFEWMKVPVGHWLIDKVFPHLGSNPNTLRNRRQIRDELVTFFERDPQPEFWAYFADYDWVVFCQIFGTMLSLPDKFPQLCLDIEQERRLRGLPRAIYTPKIEPEHNALNDARWDMENLKLVLGHPRPEVAPLADVAVYCP